MLHPELRACFLIQLLKQRGLQSNPYPLDASLESSFQCACCYCLAIWRVRPKHTTSDDVFLSFTKTALRAVYSSDETNRTEHRRLFTLGSMIPRVGGDKFADYGTAHKDSILPLSRYLTGDTGSSESFEMIKTWLDKCLNTHEKLCSTPKSREGTSMLPNHVVEVNFKTPRQIRLIHTGRREGRYACLSHCWGGHQPLQTTRKPDTLSIHLQQISETSLPRTFQDAITVIVELGIQYIWIDSLCIIQDDEEDWQAQSAQMADIYANSTITIAASASSGPHQGLFRVASTHDIGQPASRFSDIHWRSVPEHYRLDLPLLRRGWVFQERLLSPRMLHFANGELIWECLEHTECECGDMANSDAFSQYRWPVSKSHCHPAIWRLSNDDCIKTSKQWLALVKAYSQLELSKKSDIFPAISGIAKSFREATGWEYVAGMWKETILRDLLWTPFYGTKYRSVPWRAPTFSWASVDCTGIYCDGEYAWEDETALATVVDVKCCPKGDDPTGELESGYIILSGTLIQATSVGEGFLIPLGVKSKSDWENPISIKFYADIDLTHPDHGVRYGETVHCLKLLQRTLWEENVVVYLVLLKRRSKPWECDDMRGDCEFERIGLLRERLEHLPYVLEEDSPEHAIQHNAAVKII